MELRDGKILGFGNRTNETDEDYHEAEEEDVDPEDRQSKDDENQSFETIPKKSESADDKLVETNKSSKKRTEDERRVTLSAERERIIHDLKRFHVLTKCKAFDKVNRETVNSYAERLLDLNESLGDHSEMAESFQRITEINDLFIEKEDRGKALNASKDSSSSSHSIPQVIMNTATDPNLLVEPWDGTASGYYKFERRFTSTYVNNVAYTTANQFAAFSKLIGPKGRELIEDLDPTAQGLTTAMNRIKERFAHKSHIRSDIERKLANLPVVKSEYDGAGLGALVSAAESSVKVLKHAQVSDDYIELVVFGTIGSKLPRPMFTRFLENNNFTQDITRLVAHLRTRVDNIHRSDQIISTSLNIAANAKARINTVEPQPKPTQQSFQHGRQSSSGSSPTRTNQQPKNNNRNGRQSNQQSPICRLCDGPHFTFACSQGTADTRKQMATSKQLCFRCLNKHLTPCRSNYVCPCGASHSKVLCPTGGFRPQQTTPSTPTNQLNASSVTLSGPTSHSTPTKSDQTGPKSGITMSIPKAGSSHASPSKRSHLKYARPELLTTYYETVVVKINNEFVRIQLDSGAGRTLILQELADRLNLKHYSNHDLNLGGFDGLSSQYSERLVTARLRSVTTNHSLNMIMCVTPRIDHRPRAVSQELWNALKQDGFELSDSPEYDQLPISIVVGSEYYRQLFKGNYIAYSEDLSVRPSIFGWVVTGTTEEDHRSTTRQPNPPFVGLIRSVIPSESRLDSEDDFVQSFDVALHSSSNTDPKLALANHDFLSSTASSNDRKLEDEFNNEFISKNVRLQDGRYSNITPEELNKFRTMSAEMFSEVSMNLRKFRTNHQQLDELWAGPDRSAIAKVLGHAWTVLSDTFGPSIDISGYLPLANLTKREFTAFVQSIYNPTGIVAPFTLKLKLALRELWTLKLRWDDPLPEENLKHALDLIKDAQLVNGMIAPRNLLPDDDSKVTLRVYADASEKAVAVVAYCCSSKGNFHILAKTKLARTATMPELELDALGMAAAVAHQLSTIYPFVNITICGDSKCNLQRLRQHPNKQKPSIALRIRKIAKLAPTATFRHVGTKENLADIASRGSTMEQLVAAKHWLEAPELPSSTQFEHTIATKMMTINASPADKSDACTCTRYPTYQLAVNTFRVIARILKEKFNKHSDIHELDLALILLIREVQRSHFQHHIISLDNNGNVTFDEKSVLRNGVSAHIDQYGLLRLRTRLEQTIDFSYDEVFPIILPQHCHFSRLVIANVHHQEFHPGVERTHSSIRERYFIINQRKMIKHFVNSCQLCRRKRYVASSIRHGPVPSFRYDVSTPPFTNTGIDLFGPVKVPMVDDAKVYGVIYVCATSRLVFIDAIRDMTASSVFDSVTHFVARNGLPQMFYSDNGRQLIKVKKDLQEYLNEMSRKFPDKEYRFEWQHLTAHSPWKGGFYERLIRSIKEALTTVSLDHTITSKRIADQVNGKKAKLTLEQLKHIFAEIESMINNRPLFVYEGKTICPIDFKAGQGNRQLPLACKLPARYQKPNIIRDYKSFETKVNKYRKLWKTHYILELRNFHQHTEKQKVPRTFEVGDVVHVRAPSTRLDQWPLGIVTKVFSNSDGITRAVTVRTLNRGSVVEEVKDVRNLIPVEANNERHEYVEADAPPEPEVAPPDNSPFDLPNSRFRATTSRTARLQPALKKKESLEKLAKKWTKEFQIKQKEAKYRQKLRDLISGAVAEGKPKNDPQVKDWLEELYSISTSPHCRALPSCG
ncbi:hypothetical protein TYRP_010338 [Tyrophagus putrescentiae]|nr:hypothetical protein TYRP_010338 [Tyrophagus putrescentiae]